MDLSKIFLKDACPTKMGGQAVMEGIMMKGEKKTALAVRLPNDDIQIKTVPTKVYGMDEDPSFARSGGIHRFYGDRYENSHGLSRNAGGRRRRRIRRKPLRSLAQ